MKFDPDISCLSPSERLLLVEQIWDSLAASPESVPVPPAHLEELQRRLEALESGAMEPGEPWETVRERLSRG